VNHATGYVHGNILPILNMDHTVNHTMEYVLMPFFNIREPCHVYIADRKRKNSKMEEKKD